MGVIFIPDAFAEITITDDTTGGDCTTIGTWDSASRTCTFTSDLSESIAVGANNLTLDGNGHTLDGGATSYDDACNNSTSGESNGIYFNARTTVIIKNFTIKNFCYGIDFTNSVNNSVLGNTITNNYYKGVHITNANDNVISNNVITNNYREGLHIEYSVDDVISNNVFTDNGISTYQYYNCPNGVCDEDYWSLRINTSDGFSITANTISSTSTAQWGESYACQKHDYGISVSLGGNGDSLIENNNISNMCQAMVISGHTSSIIKIKNNIINSNYHGIHCTGCEIFSNTITNNEDYGLYLYQNTSIHDNTISDNTLGLSTGSYNHLIFRNTFSDNDKGLSATGQGTYLSENNFLGNTVQATSSGSNYSIYFDHLADYSWANPVHTGNSGNYWDDYSHLCDDTNVDNICDDPYPFSGGTINVDDDYVWTVQDGWLSQITNPGDLALGAADSSGAVGTFSVTATHDGSSMSVTCDTASGATFAIGNSTVTCTATNGIKTAFTVAVSLDSTSPTISVPSDITVVSPDNSGLAVTYDVTASDDFAVTTGPTCSPASGSTFAVGTTTVTCTAADAAGNVGTQTFTVTNNVEDVSPVVTVPADITAILSETETETAVEFTVTATDNFAVTVGPTCTPASGSTFSAGTTTVTCTAADAAGNVGTANFTVTVSDYDDVAPTVSVPSDITIHEIASNVGGVTTFSVNATDNVAVTTGPTCTPASGSTFAVGDNTVTCTAEDENGNIGTSTFIVTVVEYVPPQPITSFSTYTDPLNRFTIDYPSGWDTAGYLPEYGDVFFADSADADQRHGKMGVTYLAGLGTAKQTSSDSANLDALIASDINDCSSPTFADDGFICYNNVISSSTIGPFSGATDQVRKMYMIDRNWTVEYSDGSILDRVGIMLQIIDGADVWQVWTNSDIEYEAAYSAGLADAAFTFMAAVSDIPITVSVDDENYISGEIITVSGNVQAGSTTDVTISIFAPNGSIVSVSQVSASSSGFFSETINITNSFDTAGIYIVRAQHDSGTVETTFYFIQTSDLPNSVTVLTTSGSSTPGCEVNHTCYNPYVVTIAQGGTVTWQNSDNAPHTVTSGNTSGLTGIFDSGLIMAGGSYSYQFNSLGAYAYYCMVHPWMVGGVLVGPSAELDSEPEPTVDLTMNIGNTEYNLNEIITVTVGLSNISEQEQVIIDVLDPEGTPVVTRAMTVSPNSSSSIDFKVSEDSLTGNYKIVASVTVDGTTVTESIYFKIKSQYNQFQIASVEVTDQQGNPSTLNRGDMAYIKVTLTSDISIEPLVTVNLFDAELTTLGVGSVKTPLNHGESEIILSFLIPDDAALGDADIFVNAFTNWVSNGGIPLTPELSITAEISP